MDFNLSQEQALLRDNAARFAKEYTMETRRAVVAAGGFSQPRWRDFANLGWLAAGVPEALGGFGGPIETALIAEEFGRAVVADPFLGAAVLGTQLFIAGSDETSIAAILPEVLDGRSIIAAAFSEPDSRCDFSRIATVARPHGERFRLDGKKTLVLAGTIADRLIVSAKLHSGPGAAQSLGLYLIHPDAAGLTIVPTPLHDGSNAATLELRDVDAQPLGDPAMAVAALTAMAEYGIAAIAAESVGIMAAAIAITAEYVKTRQQFGVPLAALQVIQHRLADMVIDLEMSKATRNLALAAFEIEEPALRAQRFAGVKFAAGDALRRVMAGAMQSHGAMGLTDDYPIGHYLKRMMVLDAVLGSPDHHLGHYAKITRLEGVKYPASSVVR